MTNFLVNPPRPAGLFGRTQPAGGTDTVLFAPIFTPCSPVIYVMRYAGLEPLTLTVTSMRSVAKRKRFLNSIEAIP